MLGAAALTAFAAPPGLAERLEGKLVRLRGGRLTPEPAPSADRVAVYFGASWCGPCRAFLPELRAAYPRLQARGYEVVFFSDDAGCAAVRDYMVQMRMTWPAIACEARSQVPWLEAERGLALPGLLTFDRQARRLSTSWTSGGHSRPRAELARLLG